jgi:hypothetical protein
MGTPYGSSSFCKDWIQYHSFTFPPCGSAIRHRLLGSPSWHPLDRHTFHFHCWAHHLYLQSQFILDMV